MNQSESDCVATYLGLQGFDVVSVERFRDPVRGRVKVVQVARREGAAHLDAVIAGHQHHLPLGLAESINSKVAVLRFQARGYRDPEYFKLKILQRCSLPHNPWAKIVL